MHNHIQIILHLLTKGGSKHIFLQDGTTWVFNIPQIHVAHGVVEYLST